MMANQFFKTDADISGCERYCFKWQTWKDITKSKKEEERAKKVNIAPKTQDKVETKTNDSKEVKKEVEDVRGRDGRTQKDSRSY